MKKIKSKILSSIVGLLGLSLVVGGVSGSLGNKVSAAETYTENWGTHELVQQSDYELRDGATESQFISYGPSAQGKVWYSRSVANYYDLDKVTVLTSYKGYDTLLKNGTYASSTVKEQIEYATNTLGYDVIGGINGTSFDTGNGQPNMGLMINGVEYCPGEYYSHGFFGIVRNEETGDQKPVIGTAGEYAAFRDGTVTTRTENNVEVDYTGYKMWQAIGGWFPELLINNGQICPTTTWDEEHPRTAIGITADGKVMTYVVEGRNGNRAGGMSLYNMATIMQELGCIYAINLDGGGSSTALSKHAGETTYGNRIEGAYGADRSVGDAILFVSTESMTDTGEEPVDTTFAKAHVLPNNDLFVVGTTIEFSAKGSNAYGDPVDLPEGLTWELDTIKSTADIGTIDPETGVFQANGNKTGNVYVNLKQGDEIVGSTKVDLTWPSWSYSQAFTNEFTLGFNEEKTLEFTLYPDGGEGNKNLGISTWRPMVVQECDIEWNLPEGCTMTVNGDGDFVFVAGNVPVVDGVVSIKQIKATGQTNVMTKSAVVSVGKAPNILYDFEDQEWMNEWSAGGNSQSKHMYQSDNALFGNYSMAIDYDMSNGVYLPEIDETRKNRTVTFFNDKQGFTPVVPADAKYFGMWVYFPEGLDGCWFRVTLEGYQTDDNGQLIPDGEGGYVRTTSITTLSDFIAMPKSPKVDQGIQDSGEWRFYYTEIGYDTRYNNAWTGITGPYGIFSCQVMWAAFGDTLLGYDYNQPDGETPEEIAANKEAARLEILENFEKAKTGTIYVDNVMALYGNPTEDMLAPYFTQVKSKVEEDESLTLTFNLHDEDRYETGTVAGLKYQDASTLGDMFTISGIDYSTVEIYLNGNKLENTAYTIDEGTGLVTIPGVTEVVEGTSVRVVAYDRFANKLDRTTTVRSIKIYSGENNELQETHLFWDRDEITGIELPTPNSKYGHTFVEWDSAIPAIMPNKNIEIKAVYTPNLHNVTINDQNGELVTTYEDVPFGSEIPLPTVEGHTITWKEDTETLMPDNDVTLEVNKVVNQYGLTFIYNGEEIYSEDVDYGSAVAAPSLEGLNKVGHTFAGWDAVLPETMPANDLTFTAQFTVNKYKLTFNQLDGTLLEEKEVEYGSEVVIPSLPGYTSIWQDATLVPETMPAEDVELTVILVPNNYTVKFVVNEEEVQSGKVMFGSALVKPENPENNELYRFIGWDVDGDGNADEVPLVMNIPNDVTYVALFAPAKYNLTVNVEGEEPYTVAVDYDAVLPLPEREGYTASWVGEVPAKMPAENITVEATFTINKYTVSYVKDGETLAEFEITYNEAVADKVTVPTEGLDKVGHTFAGWDVELPETMPAKDVVLTAAYTVNKYTVTFIKDGETLEELEFDYGAEITVPTEGLDKVGHTFVGWNVPVVETMPAEDLTYTATYLANKYTVTFVKDGETLEEIEVTYGTEIEVPTEGLDKVGYTFSGWDVEVPEIMPAEDLTFVATYTANKYTVTFVKDGETLDEFEVTYGAKVADVVVVPTEGLDVVGFTFSGWDAELPTTMPAEDLVITAEYTINKYTVSFVVEGTTVKTGEVEYLGKIADVITAPTEGLDKVGYTFSGWDKTLPEIMPAGDLVITAKYTINKYTITFNYDGKVVETKEVEFGAQVSAPSVDSLIPTNYKFGGWDKTIPTTMPAENVVISAKSILDTDAVDAKVAAIGSAITMTDRFVAIKELEKVVNALSADEKVEHAKYVTALENAKTEYNAVVNEVNSDLDVATDVAGWVVFGLINTAALAAAGYFLMKRGLI